MGQAAVCSLSLFILLAVTEQTDSKLEGARPECESLYVKAMYMQQRMVFVEAIPSHVFGTEWATAGTF